MKRRWTRFSVRSLLVLVTLCCLALGAFVVLIQSDYHAYRREQQTLAELRSLGGSMTFIHRPCGPMWLQKWRDRVYSHRVVRLTLLQPRLSEEYLAKLSTLQHLESLSIRGGNAISDEALAQLARVSTLRRLSLSNTPVHASGKHPLGHLRLDKLTIGADAFGINESSWITDLDGLTQLVLHSPVTDSDLEALSALSSLEELTIFSDRVTDAGLIHLAGFTKLRNLYLQCPVTDAGLAHLTPLENLQRLICQTDSDRYPLYRELPLISRLMTPIAAKYREVPLTDALTATTRTASLPVRFDDAELQADGVSVDAMTLTIDANGPLTRVLDAMLRPHGLGYYTEPDGIVVTTREAAAKRRPGTTRLLEALPHLEAYVPW